MENVDPPSQFFQEKKEQKKTLSTLSVGLIAIGYIALIFGIWLYAKDSSQKPPLALSSETFILPHSVTPTPTMVPFVVKSTSSNGMYEFAILAGGDTPAPISGGALNPVDPPMGGKQNFEVTTIKGAKNVTITLTTDTKEKTIRLTKDRQQPNLWRGAWNVDDSYHLTYILQVQGTVNGATFDVPILKMQSLRNSGFEPPLILR